jgi:hypothetical protein
MLLLPHTAAAAAALHCCCCQVTTEEARVKFIEQLTEAEDWLYGDGEAEAAEAFKSRLSALKAVGEPIARRAAELELRPQVSACLTSWRV